MTAELVTAALAYALRGRAVFPVWWAVGGVCACGAPADEPCDRDAKHPVGHVVPNGFRDATRDRDTIRRWWARAPLANIGLATGAPSDCWVLDIDGARGEESLAALVAQHGPLPETATAQTGRAGGRHLYWRWPTDRAVRNSAGKLGEGLDVRGDGGYVVVPPSVYYTGRRYQWVSAVRRFADAPAWLLELVAPLPKPAPARAPIPPAERTPALGDRVERWVHRGAWAEIEAVERATEGTRNATLNRAAHALGRYVGGGLLAETEVVARLTEAAAACGLGQRETEQTIASGLAAGAEHPRDRAWVEEYLARKGRAA